MGCVRKGFKIAEPELDIGIGLDCPCGLAGAAGGGPNAGGGRELFVAAFAGGEE